jgi:hypothetical protein
MARLGIGVDGEVVGCPFGILADAVGREERGEVELGQAGRGQR